MNHLSRYMLDHYGWRGTVLLFAGIALQGAALGLLLLPPLPKMKAIDPMLCETPEIVVEGKPSSNRRRRKGKSFFTCFDGSESANDTDEAELKVFNINDTLDANVQLSRYETNVDKGVFDKKVTSVKKVLARIFSSKLLTHGGFLLFLLANFAVHLAFTIPFNLLPDQAVENGMTKHEASWLISSIGELINVFHPFIQLLFYWVIRCTYTLNVILQLSNFTGGGRLQVPLRALFRARALLNRTTDVS